MESTWSARPRHHHQQAAGLPDEMIEDIFARMPAKSVLRCQCLSRAWAAALSSDAFVDLHLRLANRRRGEDEEPIPKLCLLPDSAAASTVYAWSPADHGEFPFTPLMSVPHNTRNGRLGRGLLLVRAVAVRLYYLCNPSIGQITALPDGRMAGGGRHPGRDYASFGLGYDTRVREATVATNPESIVFLHLSGLPVVSLESCSGVDPYVCANRVVCRKPCHGLLGSSS